MRRAFSRLFALRRLLEVVADIPRTYYLRNGIRVRTTYETYRNVLLT